MVGKYSILEEKKDKILLIIPVEIKKIKKIKIKNKESEKKMRKKK